jgi:hypothetical protein
VAVFVVPIPVQVKVIEVPLRVVFARPVGATVGTDPAVVN